MRYTWAQFSQYLRLARRRRATQRRDLATDMMAAQLRALEHLKALDKATTTEPDGEA